MIKHMKKFYKTYENDMNQYSSIIVPKLTLKERPHLFCSLTYITPNYATIYAIRELGKLAKEGFHIHILLWDANSFTHKYARNFQRIRNTREEFLKDYLQEIRGIANYCGIPDDQLTIHRSTDAWKRIVTLERPALFIDLYEFLMDLQVEQADNWHKVSHLIQIPLDIFVANFFDVLYPEYTTPAMDAIFVRDSRMKLYKKTREVIFEKGLTNMEKPVFIVTEELPYIIYNNIMPEWNMTVDEIIYVLMNFQLTSEQANSIVTVVFSEHLDEFILIAQGQKIKVSIEKLLSSIPRLSPQDLYATIGMNMHLFLQKIKEGVKIGSNHEETIFVTNKSEAIAIGSVLRSGIFLDILRLADGSYTMTQIAKRLHKQVANVSVYVNKLKKLGYLEVLEKGKLRRTVHCFSINLNTGLK